MADKPPEQLGKYTLERRIASGGMAEVFLAIDDKGKRCVIKRMLPNLLIDKQFARMFLDEAKLVVQLNHPSIAQIYDFGQDKGVLFLAMEWVEGTNLRAIVKDFARRGEKIPVEYCARLVSQAALALGYAHRASGLDGKPLKIIHRDVSPQNILLGNAGEVKLIDFGVAKATSATQQTAAGMIKGKFAYMSPEQLRGNPLDGRSDIFGLGLVLYELLAAERAIPGSSEAEIAQNALTMKFPPIEQKRPDVPAPLKAIIARALAWDREQRYDTAEDLAAELETFITPRMPKLSGADVAKILPSAIPGANKESGSDQNPVAVWEGAPNSPTTKDPAPRPGAVPALKVEGRPVVDAGATAVPNAAFWNPAPYELIAKTVINPPGLVPKAASAAARTERQPAMREVQALNAELTQRDELIVAPRSALRWFIVAAVIGFAVAAAAWRLMQPTAVDPATVAATAPPPAPALVAPPPVAKDPVVVVPPPPAVPAALGAGRLVVTASIPTRVTVDGKFAGKAPIDIPLTPGPHQLGFEDLGSSARQSRKIELKPGETRTEEWKPERGRVVIRAVPWAEVFLGGKSLGVTPIDPINLLAGKHTFTFVNSDTQRQDEKTIEVKPKGDTMVKVDLRPVP